MTVRYNITRGDLLFAHFRTMTRNQYLLVLWSIVIIWSCYTAVQESKIVTHDFWHKVGFMVFLGAFYFASLFALSFAGMAGMILLRKNKGVVGEHRLRCRTKGSLNRPFTMSR